MGKFLSALALTTLSASANAVTVTLVHHDYTTGTGFPTLLGGAFTDGSHVDGFPASTATFDWDGTKLASSGLYSPTFSLGGSPYSPSLLNDQITDLSIDTATSTASATAYRCIEGTFGVDVGLNFCGGYTIGTNFIDESATVWGPGLAVSQTIGGDDVGNAATSPFRSVGGPRTISDYNFGLISWDGTTLILGNGIPIGTLGGQTLTFSTVPVPAAAWLFGSALGLVSWMRRTAK